MAYVPIHSYLPLTLLPSPHTELTAESFRQCWPGLVIIAGEFGHKRRMHEIIIESFVTMAGIIL